MAVVAAAVRTGLGSVRLPAAWLAASSAAAVVVLLAAVTFGAVDIPFTGVVVELVDRLPLISLDSGLTRTETAIVTEVRLPRALLALIVGAILATSGGAYQGVFRNPLADPYLLGVAAGAGLGATLAIAGGGVGGSGPALPMAAFLGALAAVALAYLLGVNADRLRSNASLILAGVAVAALFTAIQTYLLQRDDETIRDVYAWLLGRFNTARWDDVRLLLPYAAVTLAVLISAGRRLDVMAVGDDEAQALGLRPRRVRLVVVIAASLATAAAVAVSGLIGFVGIVVPHAVRLCAGPGHRRILPLAAVLGGAFLCVADIVARTVLAPAELPVGVITAAIGAPFFLLVLRSTRVAGP
jgi:iron complex transport system permease protein